MNNMIFNNDEKIVINSISNGSDNRTLTRTKLLTSLEFSYSVSIEPSVLDLLEGLILKVNQLSDEEWEDLKTFLPFSTDF